MKVYFILMNTYFKDIVIITKCFSTWITCLRGRTLQQILLFFLNFLFKLSLIIFYLSFLFQHSQIAQFVFVSLAYMYFFFLKLTFQVSTYFQGMNVGSATRALEQSLETIKLNINWVNQNEEHIYTWLLNNYP